MIVSHQTGPEDRSPADTIYSDDCRGIFGEIAYVYRINPAQDGPGGVKILYLPAECKKHKVTGVSHYTSQ